MQNDAAQPIKRWTAARKAAIVLKIQSGQMSRSDAAALGISEAELQSWEKLYDRHGVPGLRSMSIQYYLGGR